VYFSWGAVVGGSLKFPRSPEEIFLTPEFSELSCRVLDSSTHRTCVKGCGGMEQQSQQDPPATGRALDGEVDETLWYARSCTCGTIIDVLSALEVAPTKGGVGPQAAVEISEEAGLQIRVLEGATLHGAASLKPSLFEEWTCTFAEQAQTRPTPPHPIARNR
jgi:hypothetical protein